MEKESHQHKCLNCGREYSDANYCPECGQHKNVGRLTTKSFLISLFTGLTRINKGFLYTFWSLLIHPWKVINDYLKGKRVEYTPPVQTLIILCFISLIVEPWFVTQSSEELTDYFTLDKAGYIGHILIDTLIWYLNSPIIQNVTVFLPAIPPLMLITSSHGRLRYNFAESLLASIYASASMFAFYLVLLPLNLILPFDCGFLSSNYILAVGLIGLNKSLQGIDLPQWKRVVRIILFFFLCLLNYAIILLFAGLMVYKFILR